MSRFINNQNGGATSVSVPYNKEEREKRDKHANDDGIKGFKFLYIEFLLKTDLMSSIPS